MFLFHYHQYLSKFVEVVVVGGMSVSFKQMETILILFQLYITFRPRMKDWFTLLVFTNFYFSKKVDF